MNLDLYKPFNCIESIDKLIKDLRSGKLKYDNKALFEATVLLEIRKIKIQIYFKEKFEHLPVINAITNSHTKVPEKPVIKKNIHPSVQKKDILKSESIKNNNPIKQTNVKSKPESRKNCKTRKGGNTDNSIQHFPRSQRFSSTKTNNKKLKGKGIVKTKENSKKNLNSPNKSKNKNYETGGYNQNYKKGFGSSNGESVFDLMAIHGTGGRIINIRKK